MARLWDKGLPLDALIHRFTVGEDPRTDMRLVPHDCVASAAHAQMLAKQGFLSAGDAAALTGVLGEIVAAVEAGTFAISEEQEDGHTAIEARLTEVLGEPGKRIHLARSRNDQVQTAMRLFMREAVIDFADATAACGVAFVAIAESHGSLAMPGYTHMRRGMPSTVGLWFAAFGEALLEQALAAEALYARVDCMPLGSAAGFGVPLAIDREDVAARLGFARVQRSVVDVQNSRGRFELAVANWASELSLVLEKFFCDLALYSTEEFGFVRLPDAFTTGSSIMPQKRNPDVVELARGRCRELRGLRATVEALAGSLPSNYHRDFQLLKAPFIGLCDKTVELLAVTTHLLPGLTFDAGRMEAACTDELYAAHEAYRLVQGGMTFRDAYREVGSQLIDGTFAPDREALSATHVGSAGDLGLLETRAGLSERGAWARATRERLREAARDVLGAAG